ncbi:MAG: hypothetical protein IT168_25005 [Bryobacterales bacterium]|nr:hypothetical protein [Bryobacterales bacterium]
MSERLLSVFGRELGALPSRLGKSGSLVWLFAMMALVGVVPKLIGSEVLDLQLLRAYAALSFLFASPAVCAGVTEDARRSLPQSFLWGKVLAGTAFGFAGFLLLFAARLTALYWEAGHWFAPPADLTADLTASAFGLSVCGAAVAALVSLHTQTARSAAQIVRTGFLLLFLMAVLGLRQMPGFWRSFFSVGGAIVMVLAGAGVAWAASRDSRYSNPSGHP